MSVADVTIVDSGGANIASLLHAFERLGATAELTADEQRIRTAKRVLLPGVGAARDAMRRLDAAGIVRLLPALEQPMLGICLGMQLLGTYSEEDDTETLGVLPTRVTRLQAASGFPVPNMGWSPIRIECQHPVLADLPEPAWFYFLHSYAVPVGAHTLATAAHAAPFSAVIGRDNIVAAQFHPERSAAAGRRVLAAFLEWRP